MKKPHREPCDKASRVGQHTRTLEGKVILVTGGTGTFGRRLVATVASTCRPAKVVVFSRDEHKQLEMRQALCASAFGSVRYVLGDVRDRDALMRALRGVDVVVHAAALKQIPTAESNPLEVVKTNILGAANVIDAAVERGVGRLLALSSDKAANPVNLYGATKLCADKLFLAADEAGDGPRTRFGIVRYGNVFGSRGSVVPLFLQLRATGVLPVTDPRMTRFWITVSEGVDFTLSCLARMSGGEIFVPKIPSMRIVDLVRAIDPGCEVRVVGIRPGEKLHEVLVAPEDAHRTVEYGDRYVILPHLATYANGNGAVAGGGSPCPPGFCYSSDRNSRWLTVDELHAMVGSLA